MKIIGSFKTGKWKTRSEGRGDLELSARFKGVAPGCVGVLIVPVDLNLKRTLEVGGCDPPPFPDFLKLHRDTLVP